MKNKTMQLLHNPRCSKSRNGYNWLTENEYNFETIDYLKNPIGADELTSIVKKLGISAEQLVRKGEADFKTHFAGKKLTEDEWIAAMITYPKLIERPILIKGNKAVIGRPLENIIELAG